MMRVQGATPRLPAILASASLTVLVLTGCATTGESSDTKPSPKPTSWEQVNEAQADGKKDVATTFEEGLSTCPESITADVGTSEDGSVFEVIATGDFMARAVGPEVLSGGCVLRTTATVDNVLIVNEFAYVEGDETTIETATANLTAAGFTGTGGSMLKNPEELYVGAWLAEEIMTEEEIGDLLDLGFGTSFVMLLSWTETPLG